MQEDDENLATAFTTFRAWKMSPTKLELGGCHE
jgi:hypothetical protein